MVLTQFTDFVMIAKVAMVAIFPHVAGTDIEKRMVAAAIRELDTGKRTRCFSGLRLENWRESQLIFRNLLNFCDAARERADRHG